MWLIEVEKLTDGSETYNVTDGLSTFHCIDAYHAVDMIKSIRTNTLEEAGY